ncbi:hypothetical protein KIN20_001066 [Parelaphostrongylus tenuis]|uniref:SH3 domain-containing protein n=1 Tax=Parelaphostrongylus tenuis TaxID=148309 RepID=A0AAD5LXG7_PARTN|nr:hypothetical protein KIN20_001066 [Parelaphostrongylus tenuis]
MSTAQGDVMVGNVKSLVNRLSKDFSASKPPLSVQESRRSISLKPSQQLQHVITTFAYSAAQDDELTLELGDIVEVLEEVEDGWSRGRQLRTNIIGMFPTNFVKPNVAPSTIREEEKVVIRAPTTNADQPEANRRTPSIVGGVNVVTGKTQTEGKDEPKTKEMARVKFEYEPQHSDELRLGEIGQLITIIRKDCGDAGWFEGEINGRRGLFPDNFVELVQVPINTQSGVIYHPPLHHVKMVAKPPMVNPVGIVPPAVPAKPLKQKLSEGSIPINGSSVLTPSTTTITATNSSSTLPSCNVKHQSSAFAAARDRISKDLIVGQPGQMSSKLTKSAIISSGTESVVLSRPMSSVEIESLDDVTSPLSHVTKTRARPPGKRPATLLLSKRKESAAESSFESSSKSISTDGVEKTSLASVAPVSHSPASTHPTNRESVSSSMISSSSNPPAKVAPLRPPPVEVKVEEKKEYTPAAVKALGTSHAHPPATSSISSNIDGEWEYIPTIKAHVASQSRPATSSISSNVDAEWVSRSEYNELLARLANMEARIEQLERR